LPNSFINELKKPVMKKHSFLLLMPLFIVSIASAQVSVTGLLCENRVNPLGLDVLQPRLTWLLSSNQRNVTQSAYELQVALSPGGKDAVWSSGKVSSGQSVHVPYGGKALQSGKRYYWKVRVWDQAGKASAWSEPANWEMGLLQPADWKAKWIGQGFPEDPIMRPSPLFRKLFMVDKKVRSARAYITAHGMYEAFINGKRVGTGYLSPGWTSYNNRLQYQVYDVTDLLQSKGNVIGVQLGSGWYRSHLAWQDQKDVYGKSLGLLMQVNITYTDGSSESVITNEGWKSSIGTIVYSEIYNGEIQDARKGNDAWATASFNDASWSGVQVQESTSEKIIATYNEPIRKHERFTPVKIFTTPAGDKVVDFGQNLVGFVEVKVNGKAGDSIKLSHAEVLDKWGNFYTQNLRAAKQQNIYVLKGNGTEQFEPHFTFQGFRYVRVEGIADVKPENLTAVALYSDMKPTGTFTSSNPLLNQLQHNIQWGQKGNFLDVPTDCPQRDERLGWTGDAQAFCRTAAFNMDVSSFFSKWLKDLAADQYPNGSVPFVIPNVLDRNKGTSAGWGDVSVIAPWTMYLVYGDQRILETQYPSMKAYVDYIHKTAGDSYIWKGGSVFGDWLFYKSMRQTESDGYTNPDMIATMFYAYSASLLAKAATALGKQEDAAYYRNIFEKVKEAFRKNYVTAEGRIASDSQTGYVLALKFGLLPEDMQAKATQYLVDDIKGRDNHLSTGFLGTPYLCHVLTEHGRTDVAYDLLMQQSFPSWLYPVKMGATTIWERWDGQKPDSTFQDAGMNSFNHYAYGAIGDWMYQVVAGIDLMEADPGYRKVKIQPHIGGSLTEVAAALQTYYGLVSSHWTVKNKTLTLQIEVPGNTTAMVSIPAKSVSAVTENNIALAAVPGLKVTGMQGDRVVVEVGSGKWTFVVTE
jgi:alpha-L-rhamnosidase